MRVTSAPRGLGVRLMKRFLAALSVASVALGAVTAFVAHEARAQNTQSPPPVAPRAAPSVPASLANYLTSGEQLVRFRNGCNMILYAGEAIDTITQSSWFGKCVAGLADGPGLISYGGASADGKYYPLTMRLGRQSESPDANQGPTRIVRLPRDPGREESETVLTRRPFVNDPPASDAKVTDPKGVAALFILATVDRRDNSRSEDDSLWVVKRICPASSARSMDAEFSQLSDAPSLSPTQRAKVIPICKAALDRLKSEGRLPGSPGGGGLSGVMSSGVGFKAVDYGYYFVVFIRHDIRPLLSNGAYANYDPKTWPPPQYSDVSLCPQVTTLAGCEPIWQALLAPFVAKQDAFQAARIKAQAAGEADRERRFAPLIAARKASLRSAAMRMGATYRPRVAAPPRAPVKPKIVVRKRK